jgi:photosystem II stability/assembly factor-like uncharacterized protein
MLTRYCILLAVLTSLVSIAPSTAQWSNTGASVGRTNGSSAFGGYTCYRSGIVWAGHDRLLRSDDLGVTWAPVTLPVSAVIYSIDFYDSNVGVIGTNEGVYSTSDGGATWRNTLNVQSWQFTIDRLTGDWYLVGLNPYIVRVSRDRGQTWLNSFVPNGYVTALRSSNLGSVYITQSPGPLLSHVMQTTDRGRTWVDVNGLVDLDSHEMIFDSCDRSRMYVMNEDIASSPDNQSSIFVSTDAGVTFQQTGVIALGTVNPQNYTGGFSESSNALYAQRLDQITRSTDHGISWVDIGGPGGHIDAQYVCALTDNLILALDTNGDIWRTTNSGGSPVNISNVPTATPSRLFAGDTVAMCSSITRQLIAHAVSCGASNIAKVTIVGPDAPEFRATRTAYGPKGDSIEILFTPTRKGLHDATVLVEFSDGSTLNVPLEPVAAAGGARVWKPISLIHQDTIGGDVTFEVGESFSLPTPLSTSGFRVYVHYDPRQLLYVNAESKSATIDAHDGGGALSVDVLPSIDRGDVLARVTFHFFPDALDVGAGHIVGDSEFCSTIAIDSIVALDEESCSLSDDSAMLIEVCANLKCGMSILSQYMRQEPLLIYAVPNPASSVLLLRTNRPMDGTVRVVGVTGETVITAKLHDGRSTIDLHTLTNGVYGVEFVAEDGSTLQTRFLKQ